MYKVIKAFADLQDQKHVYKIGDEYPRKGYSPSGERVEELLSDKNKTGKPLIITEEPEPILEEKPKRRRKKNDD